MDFEKRGREVAIYICSHLFYFICFEISPRFFSKRIFLNSFALQVEGKLKDGQIKRGYSSKSNGDSDGEFATEKCNHNRRFCLNRSN